MNKNSENIETLGEINNNDLLNDSNLSDLNSSILSGISDHILNRENLSINSNYTLFNSKNFSSFLSKDQYACINCELPPEILYDSEDDQIIKIKCEKHGLKSISIKDFLQKMSKNTYHFYKCELCRQNCQKNFAQFLNIVSIAKKYYVQNVL